jgi:hypothetical protein
MNEVNIDAAKIHLYRLAEQGAGGEVRRPGFLEGQIQIADDFDRMGSAEIEELFGGEKT